MNEHGMGLGICTNSQVLARPGKKHTYLQGPESKEWVTVIESISAIGRKIQRLIIFKGKDLQTSWL